MLRQRENQLLHEFAFWGEPQPRSDSHIYELRSYHLKVSFQFALTNLVYYIFIKQPTLCVIVMIRCTFMAHFHNQSQSKAKVLFVAIRLHQIIHV